MPVNLLADEMNPQENLVNLLEDEQLDSIPDSGDPMEIARAQISKQYPGMPEWLRDAILSITPKQESPMLNSAARGVSAVTDYIPAAAGGLLQGASIPIRGVAGLIPNEYAQGLANSPDLTTLFQPVQGAGQKNVQAASELLGGLGPLSKMFQGAKYATEAAHIPKALQNALALGATGALATPGGASDRELGAAGALALGGAGKLAGKAAESVSERLPSFMKGLTSKSTPEALVSAAQKPHDKLQATADELYGQVRNAIKGRDIKIPVKEEYLSMAEDILSKTRPNKKLIEAARSGDYEGVHDLQSHLYKKGTKGLASDDIALENQGEEILELRDRINDDLERHLMTEGHTDIAHVLKQGKKAFAQLKDTYYGKNLNKGIGKLVHPELRKVPKNPERLFEENSVPMKAFLDKHPEVARHSKGIMEKEAAQKALNNIFIKSAGGSAVGLGAKGLYDLFK